MDSVAHKDLPPERLRCNRRTVFAWSAPLERAAAAADSLQEVRVACVADACRRVAFGFGTVAPLDAAVLAQSEIVPPAAGADVSAPAAGAANDAPDVGGGSAGGGSGAAGAPLLVATPAGARGLDLHGIDLVVVHGVPPSADAFVHLAGRTARYGAAGRVVVVTTAQEADRRLPALGSQLGVDFRAGRRHVAERDERLAQMWTVHEKRVRAEQKRF